MAVAAGLTGARRLDGKAAAAALDAETRSAAARLAEHLGRPPHLAVILVGENPASEVYVRNKVKRTRAAGMTSTEIRRPADITQSALIDLVAGLNADAEIDGILVQMPLPSPIDARTVIETIDPDKDVDGLTAVSAGRLIQGAPGLRPCTPLGCLHLAQAALGNLAGLHALVIGRSILVGKPAGLLFLEANATVTLAHSRTRNLPALARQADILIAAAGQAEMVRGDWIKPGGLVLDVGINRIEDPKTGKPRLIGDVAFDEAAARAGFITPVPGGIGPMTIAMLLRNTVTAAALRFGESNRFK